MKLQQAQRSQVKLRIGLSGPSGYGKTFSALLMAYGITQNWKKIAVVDTENNSASLYSHLGDFNVLNVIYQPFHFAKRKRWKL
jgi:CO dehydrogenase nickel-insertion accessory protein CooC1